MNLKINSSIRDAVQKTFVKLYRNEGKDYVTATIALNPATVKWIAEVSKDLEEGQYVTLRGSLFQSADNKASVYDGVAKPHQVGSDKVEYLG